MAESIADKQLELIGLISRAVDNLRKLAIEKQTSYAVMARISQLESNFGKFQSNHKQLMTLRTEELLKHAYFENNIYVRGEEEFLVSKADMLERLDAISTTEPVKANESASPTGHARSLPKISIPKFNGKYHEWIPFRDLFQSLVGSSKELSPVEKLHYLKVNVLHEAAKIIANIPITDDNYERAWNKLVMRYENKRSLVNVQLDTLFGLKSIVQKSANDLEHLRATVAEVLEALDALGGPIDQWDFFLVYFVCRRLDNDTHEAWEMYLGKSTDPPTYGDLNLFLEGRVRALETINARISQIKPRPSTSIQLSKQPSQFARTHAVVSTSNACSLCAAAHYIAYCPIFRSKSYEQRREFVTQKKLCFNCLGPHRISSCRTSKRCLICGQQHHTSIHPGPITHQTERVDSSNAGQGTTTQSIETNAAIAHHVATPIVNRRPQVLLPTALVTVVSPQGEKIAARALLDQGSELSLVREALVQSLRLPRRHAAISILGLGAQQNSTTRGVVTINLHSQTNPEFECEISAFVLPQITGRIPSEPVENPNWPHVTGLSLADQSFASPGPIDILLGADTYGQLLFSEVRKGASDAPIAQLTSLGWILSGPFSKKPNASPELQSAHGFNCTLDHELHELVHGFWSQEEVSSPRKSRMSEDDTLCERHFEETHSRDVNGRYIVHLPFKHLPETYGNSRAISERLSERIRRRINVDPKFLNLYINFLNEYESLGHMERIPIKDPEPQRAFYLPHHGVLRESSTTTKLRVVFNGSQKTNLDFSLNDCLHAGPKTQNDLVDVILRWRLYAYVFSADIEKMYRQILVHPEDRDHQRILWNCDLSEPPLAYRLCTVTYGLKCAPYLAIRVLRQLAKDEGERFPLAAEILLREMYVDDVLSGSHSIEGCQEKVREVDKLLKAGGFLLQKWAASNDSILAPIPSERHGTLSTMCIEGSPILRALGLAWKPENDTFIFTTYQDSNDAWPTKRSVLSHIAKLFDPLGWLSPVIVTAKIFLQTIWTANRSWDDPFPKSLAREWRNFVQDLEDITEFSIPRWLGTQASTMAIEIHGFCDASQHAIAAVVYVRVLTHLDEVYVSLVTAKTKVAPIKRVTIPRLELAAAVLLSQLVVQVSSVLTFNHAPIHLWRDSTVALTWIQGHPSRWKDFVANRVALIQELITDARWHHVDGAPNPADAASRGLSPQKLQHHEIWWKGPHWLSQPSVKWPSNLPHLSEDTNLEERSSIVLATTSASDPEIWNLINRYSSLSRLLRITAWIRRAIQQFKKSPAIPNSLPLTPEEIDQAKTFWILTTQRAYLATEISILERKHDLPRSNALLRLSPFLDQSGILRVGGRLRNAPLDEDVKHPAILPRDSTLSRLVISDAHRRTLHGGVQLTLSTIRRSIWILGGRTPVRSFITRCLRCVRQRAATATQLMGQLPSARVTPTRPFLHTGVDYAGPFILKTWRGRAAKTYKAYLVVFICFSTSAVHLELTTDYSTAGFLAAYRRFVGRRGICATLTSDCGTNFIGADAELRKLFSSASKELQNLANLLASDGTKWKFNPPSAPHFGGKWEAAIKSTKFHIRRIIGDTQLTYEEFSTFLTQVEAVLNSRPLCPLSADPNDVSALTPGHFLVGEPLNIIPEPSLYDTPVSPLTSASGAAGPVNTSGNS